MKSNTPALDEIAAYAKENCIDYAWVLTCFYRRSNPQERAHITRGLKR